MEGGFTGCTSFLTTSNTTSWGQAASSFQLLVKRSHWITISCREADSIQKEISNNKKKLWKGLIEENTNYTMLVKYNLYNTIRYLKTKLKLIATWQRKEKADSKSWFHRYRKNLSPTTFFLPGMQL